MCRATGKHSPGRARTACYDVAREELDATNPAELARLGRRNPAFAVVLGLVWTSGAP
ncbi:hypothetical protein ABZT43_45340 [Streptomyces sp. NPDC005349]|uniref:hypothetical protein n=1 Tax=Streptomyces sp. NPDC005349 TaxID=3157037 RepID=UPI0033A02551